MCGLFGAIGPASQHKGLIKALACHNISRGTHSTGFFTLSTDKKRLMLKQAVPSYEIILEPEFKQMFSKKTYAVCGHVRWATMGDVCSKNAHPFTIGNTVGSHNGVVSNVYKLKELINKTYNVDSEYLIHLINEKESVAEAAGSINLVYTKSDDSLGADIRIARHDNPMTIAVSPDKKSIVYSSDDDHLKLALAQIGLKWKMTDIPNNKQMLIYCTDGNVVHTQEEDFKCLPDAWRGHQQNYFQGD